MKKLSLFCLITFVLQLSSAFAITGDSVNCNYLYNRNVALTIRITDLHSFRLWEQGLRGIAVPISNEQELRIEYFYEDEGITYDRGIGLQCKFYQYVHSDKYSSTFIGSYIYSTYYFQRTLKLSQIPNALTARNSKSGTGAFVGMAIFPNSYLQFAAEYQIRFYYGNKPTDGTWYGINHYFEMYVILKFL